MVDLPSSIMMEDNTFQTCDSPSGSSTSEPHEEANNILSFIEPSFYNKLSQLNSSFMQQNNFVDPLLPSSEPSTNNYWPDMNHVIPELTNNFSNHIGYPRMPQVEQTTSLPGMQIRVLGVPQTGAKSRVETQIKLCIQLVTGDGDKAQRWSHLKLPEQMVAKEKLKRMISSKMENTTLLPENMLYLSSRVICASDPTRRVTTCSGCVQRERKRSQRRKENKKVESEEDEKMMTAEEQKILLFNCSEIVDFSSGDAILPTRITCYCRHHNERLGFCIYFEMHDHSGQQVASGMSPPIMITDDHKSNKLKSSRKRPRIESDNSTQRFSLFDSTRPLNYQIQPRPSVENVSFAPSSERPLLQRLIPNEGPTYGGIEVTLLGSGFRSGLTCMFGDVAASSTHYWSPNTLVCILPPAANVGTVVVSFKEYPLVIESQDVTLFTYYNENDRALMELALQVVGLKMTGKVEDAREIAMRIVQGRSTPSSQTTSGQQQNEAGVEHHILQVLQMMTTFHQVDSIDISITNAQGHTLLHFAAMLGFVQLARTLIDLGCNPNVMDNNGYTALHYAAWYQHIDLVDVLLEKGLADPEITNRWNKKPIEMTENKMIHQMICSHHDSSEGYDSDVLSADIDTSFDEEEDEDWLSHHEEEGWMDQDDDSWGPDYLSSSSADDEWTPQHDSKKFIRYLNQVETASTYSPEEIMDAEPLEHIHPPTDTEVEESSPKEMNWMQRTLSHFQPTHSLQNIKNTIPSKPTDLKTIADHILQFPSLFSSSNEPDEAPPDQTLAWYMALAYAMGTKSLVSEDEKEEQEEEVNVNNKRRDRRLYSFWVPMLCFMVIWLIFQFVSSHPNVVDTMISISGFRRQYLSIY